MSGISTSTAGGEKLNEGWLVVQSHIKSDTPSTTWKPKKDLSAKDGREPSVPKTVFGNKSAHGEENAGEKVSKLGEEALAASPRASQVNTGAFLKELKEIEVSTKDSVGSQKAIVPRALGAMAVSQGEGIPGEGKFSLSLEELQAIVAGGAFENIRAEFEKRESAILGKLGNAIIRRDAEIRRDFSVLEGQIDTLTKSKEEMEGSISRLSEEKATLEEGLSRLKLHNEQLEEQMTVFTRANAELTERFDAADERSKNADLRIIDLESRLTQTGEAYRKEIARLSSVISQLRNENSQYVERHGKQSERLSTELAEKQGELAQVNAELAERNAQLREAMTILSLDNGFSRFWSKVAIGFLGFLSLPTVVGPIKAAEWIESVDAPVNNASQTILQQSVRIADLNRLKEILSTQIAIEEEIMNGLTVVEA